MSNYGSLMVAIGDVINITVAIAAVLFVVGNYLYGVWQRHHNGNVASAVSKGEHK